MRVSKTKIYPELAEKILSNRPPNGHLQDNLISDYAQNIKDKKWGDKAGTIALSSRCLENIFLQKVIYDIEDYFLFDGHHRLNAVISSGQEVEFQTVFLDEEDWNAVINLKFPITIMNALVMIMKNNKLNKLDAEKYLKEKDLIKTTCSFSRNEYPNYEKFFSNYQKRPMLRNRAIIGLLLFYFCQDCTSDEFSKNCRKALMAKNFIKSLCCDVKPKEKDIIQSRRIAQSEENSDCLERLRGIILCWERYYQSYN